MYTQLRAQARRYMRNERSGVTLQKHRTRSRGLSTLDRRPGCRLARSRALFRVVGAAHATHPRRRGTRTGGDEARGSATRVEHASAVDFDQIPTADSSASSLCALDDALEDLTRIDPRRTKVIELRFFGGLSVEETAEVLQVSPQTVMRDWRLARAWLARELRGT